MLVSPKLLAAVLASASLLLETASAAAIPKERNFERATACSTLQIIVARGSTEAAGEGTLGDVSTAIKNQIAGSASQGIDYPATLIPYLSSEAAGVTAMISDTNAFASSCPTTPIVLMGYSQGAQVVGDTISGGQLSATAAANIVAIIQTGDPTFVKSKSYDVGTSTTNGIFARASTSALDAIASKIQSYCDSGDPFCASGFDLAVHLGYTAKYGTQAANFVVGKYQAAAKRA